jgi:hypothetical protein
MELSRQNSYQQDTVIRSVAQICQDLESRCNSVEEPLRREQAKVKDLTAEVTQLRQQVRLLETEAIDRQLYADGFEAELSNVESERNELLTRLAELKADLAQANRQTDETLRNAHEQFNAKELELRSTILTHEEELHARSERIEDLGTRVEDFERRLQREHDEKVELAALHASLQTRFDALEQKLESKRQNIVQQAEEIVQLRASEGNLHDRLAETKKELEVTIDQRDEVQANHEALIRSSEQALRDLETRYTNDMGAAARKTRETQDHLQAKLQEAIAGQQHVKATYEDARRDLQLAQTMINSLENKINQATDACVEKDAELDELKSWRSRVLQSMGLPTEDIPKPSCPRQSTQSGSQQSMRHRRPHKSLTQPPVDIPPVQASAGIPGINGTAMDNVANASFSENDCSERDGSTPKRPRPRPSFKVPDMHTPHSRLSGRIHKTASKQTKRPALGALSPNRRHTTVGLMISENEEYEDTSGAAKRRGSLQFHEQESFDMDGLLSGTPFTPGKFGCSTQRVPEEDEGTGDQTTEL